MRPLSVLNIRATHWGNRCDFCGSPFVHKLYACRNFHFDGKPVFATDQGRWAACDKCLRLVDAGAWPRVATRVLKYAPDKSLRLRRDLSRFLLMLNEHITPGQAFTVLQPHYARGKPIENLC